MAKIRTRYDGLCPENGEHAEIAALISVSTRLGAASPNAAAHSRSKSLRDAGFCPLLHVGSDHKMVMIHLRP